jgi:hypothetical protein
LPGEVAIHLCEQIFRELVLLQMLARLQDRGLIRDAVIIEFNPGEPDPASLSYGISSATGSLSAHHCGNKYTNSIVSIGIGGRPPFDPTFGKCGAIQFEYQSEKSNVERC